MENISLVKMEMTTFKSIASFSRIFLSVYIIKTKYLLLFQTRENIGPADRQAGSRENLFLRTNSKAVQSVLASNVGC